MEAAVLTLSGISVAGSTDGSKVSLTISSWLRLGGEVALDRAALGPASAPRRAPRPPEEYIFAAGSPFLPAALHLRRRPFVWHPPRCWADARPIQLNLRNLQQDVNLQLHNSLPTSTI